MNFLDVLVLCVDVSDLLAFLEPPNGNSDDPVTKALRLLWDTVESIARKGQYTLRHLPRNSRVAAARVDDGVSPYRPLEPYLNAKTFAKNVQHWRKILIFIARMETGWTWKAQRPCYSMTSCSVLAGSVCGSRLCSRPGILARLRAVKTTNARPLPSMRSWPNVWTFALDF